MPFKPPPLESEEKPKPRAFTPPPLESAWKPVDESASAWRPVEEHGPWEQYQKKPQPEQGPWTQYAAPAKPGAFVPPPLESEWKPVEEQPKPAYAPQPPQTFGRGLVEGLKALNPLPGLVQMVGHPIDTAKNIWGAGLVEQGKAREAFQRGLRAPLVNPLNPMSVLRQPRRPHQQVLCQRGR